jgi:hypothetical protein
MALPFTLKSILRQKKNYENSNIHHAKYNLQKSPSKINQNPSRYHNSITYLKSKYKSLFHKSFIPITSSFPNF